MPASSADLPRNGPEIVSGSCPRRLWAVFSFPHDAPLKESASCHGPLPGWNLRPGGIVEWLAASRPSREPWLPPSSCGRNCGPHGESWPSSIPPRSVMYPRFRVGASVRDKDPLVRPNSQLEACWAISNAFGVPACPPCGRGSSRLSPRIRRRWQFAAEVGGGVGIIFRPETARREPVWADLRCSSRAARRPGRDKMGADRCPLSPGRSGRNRPGLGARPCRGCYACGSRAGRSSGCGASSGSSGRSWSCS